MTKPRRWGRRVVVALLVLGVLVVWMRGWRGGGTVAEGSVVLLDLGGGYAEDVADDPLTRLAGGGERLSLLDLLLLIRDAGEDPRVAGLVVRVRPLEIGWAKAQDIRDALLRFRESGKPLHAYLELEIGSAMLEYYVASAAEKIHLPPGSAAPLTGLLAQFMFLGGVWEKLDVEMQVLKIREYKSFGDMLANKEMSAAHREMADALLDSTYAQLVDGIAAQRGLDPAAVRAAIDAGPATPDELQAAGLVDEAAFLDELRAQLTEGDEAFLAAEDYASARRPLPNAVAVDRRLAIVYGAGTVTTGKSDDSPVGGQGTMGADSLVEAFQEAGEDETIDAIVFRIDSPGGSALASDLIWRAVRAAAAAKPVIVSMSDVAASGGYYAAAGANRIVAQPGTLTGSIGVVMAKPNVDGLLQRLGINTEEIRRGDLATMMSVTSSLTPAELRRLNATMEYVYDLFLQRVAEGRKLEKAQVNEVGRGRVWTGTQAREHGLVDELGGFLAAINAAKTAVGIEVEQRVELVFFPHHKGLLERLSDLLGSRVAAGLPRWWRSIERVTAAWHFEPGSVLALWPGEVVIR